MQHNLYSIENDVEDNGVKECYQIHQQVQTCLKTLIGTSFELQAAK